MIIGLLRPDPSGRRFEAGGDGRRRDRIGIVTAAILSFGRRRPDTAPLPPKMPWQNQDLAELYRVRDRLCAAGLEVEVEGGVSDEGDPWFVYQQAGTDNVVVHIARIDDEIHVINCVTGSTYVGKSFREVSDRMLEDAPLALGAQLRRSSNVVLHPSAFLTAFVAAAIMLVDLLEHGRAEAAETGGADGHGHAGGAHHDGAWFAQSSHATKEGGEAAQGAPSQAKGETEDGGLHRRLGKEGLSASGSAPANGNAPALAAPAVASHGFFGDLPGSGASFALTAGMFAAEILRVFASEDASRQGGSGFAADFTALLTSFVSHDAAVAKGAPADEASSFALASGTSGDVGAGDPALSAHIAAPSLSGEGLAHAFSVKAAVQPAPEPAGLVALDLHKAPAPVEKGAPSLAAAALPSPSTPASTSDQPPAPAASHMAEPAQGATAPASGATAAPIAAATVALPAAPAKDGAADAIDLGWVVSQLLKRGGGAVDAALKLPAVSTSDATKTAADVASSAKTAASATAADAGKDKPIAESGTQIAEKTAVAASVDKVASVLDATAGRDAGPAKPLADAAPLVLHIETDGTLGKLVAGRTETVHYVTGSILTVEGFVFGEDVLSFGEGAGDRLSATAHQEGTDLILGDAASGLVRLVGVLADPMILSHQGVAAAG
jgi:hypothetical protein